MPKKFVEKFAENSRVNMFGFITKTTIPESLRDNIKIDEQTFEVEIKIKPSSKSSLNPSSKKTSKILELIGEKIFDGHPLKEGKKTVVYLADRDKRKAHYDIERELKEIKPTIYLEDDGILCDSKTGLPDFKDIQSYSVDLLEEIKKEFYQSEINEF